MKLLLIAVTAALLTISARGESTPAENEIRRAVGQIKPDSGYREDGWWVWCTSIIGDDEGKFHMYASRWPKTLPMHPGWMVASEVIHCVSDNVEGPYQFSDIALGDRGPQYWDGRSAHNPRIFHIGDEYVLFYMGSTHPFGDARENPEKVTLDSPYAIVGRANKRIGVASSKSPYGPWKRLDRPVLDVKPGTYYSYLTSNPAPWIEKDGSVTLIFKARRHLDKFPFHSAMMLGLATAPKYDGPYIVSGEKPLFGDGADNHWEVEDPCLWRDERGYHMLAKDQQGKITGERGFGVLAHSPDAKKWTLDPSPTAYAKTFEMSDGSTFTYGQTERANIIIQNGKPRALSFAVMDGRGGFSGGKNSWNIVVPLNGEKFR
ncbi:MAG: glycoside hydrolase family protein [Verrucomicrobiota bacterium]